MEKVKLKEHFISDIYFYQEGPGVRKTQFTDNGVKLLNVGNINNGRINLSSTKINISEEEANGRYSHFLVDEGDLLIACSGIVVENFHNKIAFASKENLPLCLNTSTMRFKQLPEKKGDLNYLKYFLQTILFKKQLTKLITGSAQLNFGPSHIRKIKIPLPDLPTQQKIAKILDKADELRQYNKQLIEKYDSLVQSLFLDMFGDPIHNLKNWEEVRFEEVGQLDRGKSKHRPRNAPKLLNGPYPLIQTGDVANSGGYIKNFKSTYSEVGLKQSKLWPNGTLCITIAANIAKTGILTFEACFPDSVVGFIPNKRTNNIYVQNWISFLQEMLEEKAPMAAQKNINLAILKDLEFMNPPIELQTKFAEIVQIIENQKQQAQESSEKSELLFQSLLNKAFNGGLN